ncbi:MAG: sodium:proton antiporter [Actinomycetota bacterium]|nr:sodium:proton antiporter [Actinomycetota bacterium]
MILAVSLVVAVVFGSGVYLLLQRDLLRVVVGIVLISNSAIFFVIAAGLTRGAVPILPLPEGEPASDPLVQAMAITALVISSSVTALLLSLVYRIYVSHETVDLMDVSEAEMREAEALEREGEPETEEEPEEEPAEEELEERSR